MNRLVLAVAKKKQKRVDSVVLLVSAFAMIPPLLKLILG